MKENNYTDLDNLFRQRLGDKGRFGPEFEPSESVWQGARKELDREKGNPQWSIPGQTAESVTRIGWPATGSFACLTAAWEALY